MNVALVILHADPHRGGAERYTVDLAHALTQRGHRVSLLATTFAGTIDSAVTRVPLRASGRSRTARYTAFMDHLDAHLNVTRYDVVHAMLPVRRCDLYHPHAGCAVEAVARGHLTKSGWFGRALARIGNRLNRRRQAFAVVERQLLTGPTPPVVLTLSDYVKRPFREFFPRLPESRLVAMFNGVDLDRFDPTADLLARDTLRRSLALNPDDVVALFIGQDFARKGLFEAMQALDRIDDPRLKLVVVGRNDKGTFGRNVARQGRAHRVHFVGPQSDTRPYYAAADVFMLPTKHDPCSLVVLEALAMGLPVISTRFNGATEVMTDAHGSVLPDPTDVASLADAMRSMLDPDRRRAASAAATALRPALSQSNHLDRLEGVYQSVAPRH